MIYPPIVNFAMPAFDYKKPIRVYFAISTYNTLSDIAQAQVTVRYQTNNTNALDTSKYPNKIKTCSITEVIPQDDATIAATAARFFITIDPGDLITGSFDPAMIYKVQIRFSTKSWGDRDSITDLASSASEWSTVCLIKPIEVPIFTILELEQQDNVSDSEAISTVLATLEPDFIGAYMPATKTETLKKWRMRLYNSQGTVLLADTGEKTANSYEVDQNDGRISFQGHLQYQMSNSTSYKLVFDIQTKNGYTASKNYHFTAMSYSTGTIDGLLSLSIDEEDGYAKVSLKGNGSIVHMNVTLRRTSSKSNFTIWEDVANKTFENSTLDWDYYDFSIESGVFYQYGAQSRDNRGRRSAMIKTTQEMGQFDDAFLTEHGESLQDAVQLKIRYDMNISNSMINIGQAKTDTIGSKYPYIRRNGDMYYHSFPFSFLITAYTDNNHIFATEDELKDNQKNLYAIARGVHSLSVYSGEYDYVYEREFRQKVQKFLYNNKVKLFRSLTQGNMLIKLMGITLTPKQELGRLLYSVDATAVEIDEVTIERLDYYGIQKIGTYNPNIIFNEAKIGQANLINREWKNNGELQTVERQWQAGHNIMQDIGKMYHLGEDINNVKVDNLLISYLRIEINSQPYLIKNVGGELLPLDDIDSSDIEGRDVDEVNEETLLGTLIKIGNTTILIEYPNNIYQIKGDNVAIDTNWQIVPLKNTKMLIDMAVSLSQSISNARVATTLVYKAVNGQLFGTFRTRESLQNKIWYKYYLDLFGARPENVEKTYYVKVNVLYNLNIDAEPGTVFYAQSNTDHKLRRFVVDETGQLFIDPDEDNGYLTQAYFYGINIQKRFLHNKGTEKPQYPVQLDYYLENGTNAFIYYNGQWRTGVQQDNGTSYDIPCKVEAIVNYYIQTEKGYY